jgi:hypothetical protein
MTPDRRHAHLAAPGRERRPALVRTSEVGQWVPIDVTQAVPKRSTAAHLRSAFALAGSSGDINNGKIWDVSFGRADWYDHSRARGSRSPSACPASLIPAPITVGSLNYTSVASPSSKNKLTNGTFRYGTLEGHTNQTYWLDPGRSSTTAATSAGAPAGDVNPNTGDPALRFSTLGSWKSIEQIATGLAGGRTYTFSGWYKSSISGMRSDVRIDFQDAAGSRWAAAARPRTAAPGRGSG